MKKQYRLKKHSTKKNIISILFTLPIFLFFFTNITSHLSTQSKARIAVLISSDTYLYAQGLSGLQSNIETRMDVHYLDLLAKNDQELSNYWNRINSSKYSLIVAIGRQASESSIEKVHSHPVVISMVNAPRFLIKSDNVCGVGLDISLRHYFTTLKEIKPNSQKVVAFYSTPEGKFLSQEGTYFDFQYNLRYSPYRISDASDLDSLLQEKLKGADAFYMVPDAIYTQKTFQKISQFAQKNHIILMTPFPSLVRSGAFFGLSSDYGDLGVQTGQMVQDILSNKLTCKQAGSRLSSNYLFYLNENFAKKSKVNIPDSIKNRARLSKLTQTAIKLFYQNRFSTAKKVFAYILSRDSENHMVTYYRNLLVRKQTRKQTEILMNEAKNLYETKSYRQARNKYTQILQLNPRDKDAKSGFEKSTYSQSNKEYQNALSLERRAQPFKAIQQFQTSLRTLPSNQKSHSKLNELRSRMQSKVKKLMKVGVSDYNERNYKNAIQIFKNILLVRPGHKKAVEYLRQAEKKKNAIEKRLKHS